MNDLEAYYNKFNEDKRLDSRHGRIEFRTTWDYIHRYIPPADSGTTIRVADIGAGTGRYCLALAGEGYELTAAEPVQGNLGRILLKAGESAKAGRPLSLKAYKDNALKLKHFPDNFFDAVLFLGPMYHLTREEDKLQALSEAKRIARPQSPIFVAYLLNEYGVLTYGIREGHLTESLSQGLLTEDFRIVSDEQGLYSYVRLEDIAGYNEKVGLQRKLILTPDGPANYLRREVNALSEEAYEAFYRYHRSTCERPELMGAAGHILDIVYKSV